MKNFNYLFLILFWGTLSCSNVDQMDSQSSVPDEQNSLINLIKEFDTNHYGVVSKSSTTSELTIKNVETKTYTFNIKDETSNLLKSNSYNAKSLESATVVVSTVEFEKNGKSGFSIASDDERINKVYAYSEYGQLSDTVYNIPLKDYLSKIEQACKKDLINYYQDKNTKATVYHLIVNPITNLEWDQTAPYNLLCPTCSSISWEYAGRCPAGCTPVAAAQVIAYLCPPSLSSYNISSLRAIKSYPLGTTTGSWTSNMSVFIRYIGTCLSAKYACDGTGANYSEIGEEFDRWGILHKYYEDKNIDLNWLAYNLYSKRPHLTSGFTKKPRSGHSWVWEGIDCYHSGISSQYQRVYIEPGRTVMLYCNWGWGGRSNGWYVDYETPTGQGTYLDDNIQLYITGTSFTVPPTPASAN